MYHARRDAASILSTLLRSEPALRLGLRCVAIPSSHRALQLAPELERRLREQLNDERERPRVPNGGNRVPPRDALRRPALETGQRQTLVSRNARPPVSA